MQHEGVKPPTGLTKVILAASAGTLIEWYDFFIFASLTTSLAAHFFAEGTSTSGILKTLGTFATGFIARPFGAVIFGRMGDMLGRKHTFLLTLLMMGFATAAIGLIPDYAKIGIGAPILLILLRLVQGLALGGQYGGAALYIAEHAPDNRRGYYTSFLQTTPTLGLLLTLVIIAILKAKMGADFATYGWRIPFLLSSILVIFSYLIRRRMTESPAYAALKAEGGVSKNPLVESFVNPVNRKKVLIALFGLTAGQGVVWYTAQFYVNLFMSQTMHVSQPTVDRIVMYALIAGTPFFVIFGSLSDRIGRKNMIMLGLALSAIAYGPVYKTMQSLATVDTIGGVAKSHYVTPDGASSGAAKSLRIVEITDDSGNAEKTTYDSAPTAPATATTPAHTHADPKVEVVVTQKVMWMLIGLVFLQIFFVTMVYGPTAAFLVEMFPVSIRYTSLSVPYHIGNGVFGGLVPVIGVGLADMMHNPLAGLFFPIGVASITVIIGYFLIHEVKSHPETDEDVDEVEGFIEET